MVTDPYDHAVVGYGPLSVSGDVVSISQDTPAYNNISAVKRKKRVLKGPGEYEISSVFITAIRTNGEKKRKKNEFYNTLYVFDYGGIAIAHLGNMHRVPSQSQIEALGAADIALVPVGGGKGLSAAKASEVISLLEPGIVIPMHYRTSDTKLKLDPLNKFMKEMGLSEVESVAELTVSSSSIPTETEVVVLDCQT